jgi:hypothetical protein
MAQRGLDVTFVEDAIGHGQSDRRGPILTWLADAYELKIQTTEQTIASLGGQAW